MALSTINNSSMADTAVHGVRNLIINGAMQVAQRGTSAVPVGGSTFRIDRFAVNKSNDGAYTVEQSTDAPTGFTTSLKAQVTIDDTSLSAAQNAYLYQAIEAQNLQHLNYGTSDAKTVTLSFWVKSSKTGIYTASLYKADSTSYMFTQEYTISSVNTWEKKTITITPTAGSTSFITASGGAIANDNGVGIYVNFNLAFGSDYTGGTSNSWSSTTADYSTTNAVNWMDSTSNNFYLTGVQLEVGDTATPFEHRSYGDELARCQRYFYPVHPLNNASGPIGFSYYYVSSTLLGIHQFPVTMRTAPTITSSNSSSHFTTTNNDVMDYLLGNRVTQNVLEYYNNTQASGTALSATISRSNSVDAFVYASAEL
jgi:hypothetical protein